MNAAQVKHEWCMNYLGVTPSTARKHLMYNRVRWAEHELVALGTDRSDLDEDNELGYLEGKLGVDYICGGEFLYVYFIRDPRTAKLHLVEDESLVEALRKVQQSYGQVVDSYVIGFSYTKVPISEEDKCCAYCARCSLSKYDAGIMSWKEIIDIPVTPGILEDFFRRIFPVGKESATSSPQPTQSQQSSISTVDSMEQFLESKKDGGVRFIKSVNVQNKSADSIQSIGMKSNNVRWSLIYLGNSTFEVVDPVPFPDALTFDVNYAFEEALFTSTIKREYTLRFVGQRVPNSKRLTLKLQVVLDKDGKMYDPRKYDNPFQFDWKQVFRSYTGTRE